MALLAQPLAPAAICPTDAGTMETDFHWAKLLPPPPKSQGSRQIKTQWARGESSTQTELGVRVATPGQPGLLTRPLTLRQGHGWASGRSR